MNFLAILIICGIIGGLVGKVLNYRVPDSVAGCIGAALGYEFLPHFIWIFNLPCFNWVCYIHYYYLNDFNNKKTEQKA